MKTPDEQLLHVALRTKFPLFVQKVFATLNPGATYHQNWHILAMCYAVMECVNGDVDRLNINLPPRCLKSIVCSIALPAFLLGHNPAMSIIVVSYGEDLAKDLARKFRTIVKSDWYCQTFPNMQISETKDTELETATTMNGGRLAVAFGGAITGRGADLIIIDDPMKAQDGSSQYEQERVYRTYNETIATRFNDPANSKLIVAMQRLSEGDLSGRLLETGQFKNLCIPAICEQTTKYRIGIGENDEFTFRKGDLLQPGRLSSESLSERLASMGSSAFAAQFLQNPEPSDGEHIKREWINRYKKRPDFSEFERIVQSWDTAVKTGERNDYSACVTIGVRDGKFYVLNASQCRVNLHELQCRAVTHADFWHADTILVEDANVGTALSQHLYRATNLAVFPVAPKGAKEVRVERAAAHIQTGRLVLPENEHWCSKLERQMYAFPNGKHDDLIDALAQCINWLTTHSSRKIEVRVSSIGGDTNTIIHRDRYFERTGNPTFGNLK